MPVGKSSKGIELTNLEADQWKLVRSRMDYDLQVLRVAKVKLSTWESAHYHQELTHRQNAWQNSLNGAQNFLHSNSKIVVSTRGQEVLQELAAFKESWCRSHGLKPASVATIVILNWASLCRLKQEISETQAAVLGVTLQDPASVGVVLLPEYTHQKGQRWRSEYAALETLAAHNVNLDRCLALQFAARCDQRDSRPLVYHGRIVTGQCFSEQKWAFRNCNLVREGRTKPVDQVATSDMQIVEDIDEAALPNSIGTVESNLYGPRKFEQVGSALYGAILESVLDGAALDGRGGVVVVDLNVLTGDCFHAWLSCKKSWGPASAFFGYADEALTKEWLQQTLSEKLARMHLDEDFPLPGCQKIPKEIPADLVVEKPKRPALNLLVGLGPDGLHPGFPDALIKEWSVHDVFGAEFREVMAEVEKEFGPVPQDMT